MNFLADDPSYHGCLRRGLEASTSCFAWNHAGRKGAHVARAALAVMTYQAESGTGCPIGMTFAAVPALLRASRDLAEHWVNGLCIPRYDPRDIPSEEKMKDGFGLTVGMSMTEKQGGSDVRSNTTVATPLKGDDCSSGSSFALRGHKWFTSAPMSDAFLTLAQTPRGLSCFLVPRWLPDGRRNEGLRIMRLKSKLGDRSNASSEVEYDNALGVLVGEEGRGVPTILDMVVHTRLDCALYSAALMRQATRSAIHHARHRSAFGAALIEQPLMQSVLADLALESEIAVAMSMRLAAAFDHCAGNVDVGRMHEGNTAYDRLSQLESSDARLAVGRDADAFRRLATAVTKYAVCKRAVGVVAEALECHGGNGYVEEWHVPRWYRQAPLNSIWEGSGNVQCLDILRTCMKEPNALPAFLAEMEASRGAICAEYDALLDELHEFAGRPHDEGTVGSARAFAEALATALMGSVLHAKGNSALLTLFASTRLQSVVHLKGANQSFGAFRVGAGGVDSRVIREILDRQL